jgi:protein-tyrosine phosphatase
MEHELERLVAAVKASGIPVDVLPGGEVDVGVVRGLDVGELRRFALGGSVGYLLVEFPYVGWGKELLDALSHLEAAGLRPVLAHPERNPNVQARPAALEPLVATGALVQLTAASVDGRLGRRAQETAFSLLAFELAHLLASDAHGFEVRRVGLGGAARRLRDDALARWLTVDVPGAILAGGDLPPRPPRARRRFW